MKEKAQQHRGWKDAGIRILRAISWLVLIGCATGLICLAWQQFQAEKLSRNLLELYYGDGDIEAGERAEGAAEDERASTHGGELKLSEALAEESDSLGLNAALSNTEASGGDGADAEEIVIVPIGTLPVETAVPPAPVIDGRFTSLHALNPDIVGWISLCEDIEEPVLLRDNSYYMNHNFEGNYSTSGSVFLDEENAATLSDQMTLIYGHNMKSGAMFGDLDRLREESYLDAHPIIRLHSVYEPEPRNYVICSLFDASMAGGDPSYIHIRQFNFDTPELFQAQLDDIMARSLIDIPIEVTTDDEYIMLVTCSYSNVDGRFMVVARRLREDESPDSVQQYFSQQ